MIVLCNMHSNCLLVAIFPSNGSSVPWSDPYHTCPSLFCGTVLIRSNCANENEMPVPSLLSFAADKEEEVWFYRDVFLHTSG